MCDSHEPLAFVLGALMLLDLNVRYLVPERMDDPSLDCGEHQRALKGLRRINKLCKPDQYIAQAICNCAIQSQLENIRVLDLGCGSGDVAAQVVRRLSKSFSGELVGMDMSEIAIETARHQVSNQKNSQWNISFQQWNVFDSLPDSFEKFDFVICSLFLHHFSDSQIASLIAIMKRLSKRAVIVDDLCRTTWGWVLAYAGCRILSRSSVVHFDGPQSVRAALTIREAHDLAIACGFRHVSIRKHWPERFLMICENPT